MLDLAIDDRLFITSETDAAIQELDLLFNTENTELLGDPQYGCNFEQFLWQQNPSPTELQKYITEKLQGTLFCNRVETTIQVNILEGDFRNIYQVLINISDEEGLKGTRIYQLR